MGRSVPASGVRWVPTPGRDAVTTTTAGREFDVVNTMLWEAAQMIETTRTAAWQRGPLTIYRLQRLALAACVVLGPIAILIAALANPPYYGSGPGEAATI